jgi:hypothetical protein
MLCQLGGILTALGTQIVQALPSLATTVGQVGLNIGSQFVSGLVNRELTRDQRRDAEDLIKAQLRAASNAVSPVVAPQQGPQFSGGPPTGQAFIPPTLIPPGPSPSNQAFPINPEFAVGSQLVDTRQAGFGTFLGNILRRPAARASELARQFSPRTPVGRRMIGTAAAGVAAETAITMGLDATLAPGTAFAPGFVGPLPRGATRAMPNGVSVPSGLPSIGRFQRDATGVQVQWFFFDGTNMTPIDRAQARECVKKECIFRFDVFRQKFVKLGRRRLNPMNVRAFFRAGRRVDAAERICRKMFSEKRKQKTGSVRRKSRTRKK